MLLRRLYRTEVNYVCIRLCLHYWKTGNPELKSVNFQTNREKKAVSSKCFKIHLLSPYSLPQNLNPFWMNDIFDIESFFRNILNKLQIFLFTNIWNQNGMVFFLTCNHRLHNRCAHMFFLPGKVSPYFPHA